MESADDLESKDDLMRPCSVCGKQISKQAKNCPNCGQDYVAWDNPETKEREYLTPAERKEKFSAEPIDYGCVGCITLIIAAPIMIYLYLLIFG